MEIPPHVQQQMDALSQDLSREDDMGAVIRAHIHIENLLIQLVERHLPQPSQLKHMDLDYHGYVCLALTLGLSEERGSSLRAMGKLRNDFAHKSGTVLDASRVKNLYETLAPMDKAQVHASFSRIHSENESVQVVKNYSELDPKDQFRLIALVMWTRLQSGLLKVQKLPTTNT